MDYIRTTFSLVFIFSILLHRDILCRSINGENNSIAIFTQKEPFNVPYLKNLTEEESDLNETQTNSNNISIDTSFHKFNPNATFIQEEQSNELHFNRSPIEESLISNAINETNSININVVLVMPPRIRRYSTISGNSEGTVSLTIIIIAIISYLIYKCCSICSEKETETQEKQKEIDPETARNILYLAIQKLAQDSAQNQSSQTVPPPYSTA